MDTVTTRDGLALPLRHWPLPAARGQALIVHGLGEHSGRYQALARDLNAQGWAVSGYDQRGHGRAPGPRGVIPVADSLCDDLARVIDALQAAGQPPAVLLGHSMGGLVAARFVAEALQPQPAAWSRPVPRLVLSSPALVADLGSLQRLQLALMHAVAPSLRLPNGLDPAWVSRDPAVVKAYVNDPLVHDRICARLVRFILDGGDLVRSLAPRWTTPTLLMWAGIDRCVAPAGSAAFAAAAPPAVVQAQPWPTLAHEIFNEPERAQVIDRLVQFLQAA
ncbi:MAG: alpha/beta hydrolase [Rubrivivax sp.]|jgi:alpha-beta hydrolase superfamily lysophospholipase|nr:alpha/beta hydrolase [Rubrivivax sp.]